ncbi:hypothetical protein NECAME_03138 [Necator americanus]|uniref:Uncharacterized protein n=1 Tax=Necator americanus TaxID=51031 RepID=W2T913_NECAM|nr:hypothetical protein NECAME_03138 [Necator americanus]ETN77477.1 hypothetical protein NECAME_03138 [Necator americanus]
MKKSNYTSTSTSAKKGATRTRTDELPLEENDLLDQHWKRKKTNERHCTTEYLKLYVTKSPADERRLTKTSLKALKWRHCQTKIHAKFNRCSLKHWELLNKPSSGNGKKRKVDLDAGVIQACIIRSSMAASDKSTGIVSTDRHPSPFPFR